jgi:polar amino acid transport system substrate-binding protein
MKKILFILAMLAVVTMAFAGGASEEASALRIGTSPDYPPFEALGENGELVGFDIELMDEVAAIMGEEIEYIQLDFSVIISSLNSSQVALGLSGFTYSPDRDVLFSEPYYMSAQAVVITSDSDITSLDELGDKKIAAGLGTTGEVAVTEAYPDAELVYPDDYMIGFEMLRAGQVDAVVCDLGVAQNYALQDTYAMLDDYLQSEEMSIIVKKGNDELMAKINAAIIEFKATEAYTVLLEKWELN